LGLIKYFPEPPK